MQNHIYILNIDTATPVCSVSLSDAGLEIDRREVNEANIHAKVLTVFIEELLKENEISFENLSAVSVSKGPGSYTGLRIGVSVAKGLCYALDIPLLSVETLSSMAYGYSLSHTIQDNEVLCPMIDARRMEVYCSQYDSKLKLLEETKALIIDPASFDKWNNQDKKVILFGSGADKLKEMFHDHPFVQVVTGFQNSASFLHQESYQKFLQQSFEDLAYFEPFYLKDFIAIPAKKLL